MLKKIGLSGAGFLFLASPLFVAATTDPIAELRIRIAELQEQLAKLMVQSNYNVGHGAQGLSDYCDVPFANNLMIGSTDAKTDGEVTRLQQFLQSQGYTEARITGYYGTLTARLVMQWQKAHGMDFVTLKSGVGPMTRGKIREACSASSGGWTSYSDTAHHFSFQYPGSTFTLTPVTTNISGTAQYEGVKLISSANVGKIGKKECMYGESGITVACSVVSEAGVEFVVVNAPSESLASAMSGWSKTTVTVAGRQAVKYSIGAEGDGVDAYFIPLSSDRTLVIKRVYRYSYGEFPSQLLFDQILATLALTQVVTVNISVSGLNEPQITLLGSATVLGQNYLRLRNVSDATDAMLGIRLIGGGLGDSCVDTVQATLEISNPSLETNYLTMHGDTVVGATLIGVVSHDTPVHKCAT